jgi:HSP20 family protein
MSYYITSHPRYWQHIAQDSDNEQDTYSRLPLNVQEEDGAFAFSAVVPGLTAEDLNIEVLKDVITIKGEYKSEDSKFLLNELPSGKFSRSLRLPVELDAARAEAEIKDGVLTVRVPKAEHSLPRQIKVSVN